MCQDVNSSSDSKDGRMAASPYSDRLQSRYRIVNITSVTPGHKRLSYVVLQLRSKKYKLMRGRHSIFSGVAKSSTSFGWGKGWNVTSAGWQVTLCDPIWHVSSISGVATSVGELLYSCYFTLLYFTLLYFFSVK